MFPLNLQRNIVQLDRQISLLEHECKNMEAEQRKKISKAEPSHSICSKISNTRLKPSPVKVSLKKTDSTKKRKLTPTLSAGVQSTSSVQYSCPREGGEIANSLTKKRTNVRALNSNSCCCKFQCSPSHNSKKNIKCGKCVCCSELSVSDILKEGEGFEENKEDYLLCKELLLSNTSGAIEVRVTRKSNSGKENSPVDPKSSSRKSLNSESRLDKVVDDCKRQSKGQKWSEILCGESPKRKDVKNARKNKALPDETKIIDQPLNSPSENKSVGKPCHCQENNTQEESIVIPIKLTPSQPSLIKEPEINNKKIEETQSCRENCCGEPAKELNDPAQFFRFLISKFQQMPSEDLKKIFIDGNRNEPVSDSALEKNKNNIIWNEADENNAAFLTSVKHHCENIIKEKALLSHQLTAKDKTIAVLKKREEEYLSLIDSLKSSLEKTKEAVQEGANAVKEMNMMKSKYLQQLKLSEALQQSLLKCQKLLEENILENDKLKTEIKIFKLEAQKNEVLLAGKEAEINRYKEEILNFQRQISEHLASLKLNAQEINVEKMVEAIVQQSQLFALSEFDSVVEKDRKDSSRLQNILIHSSPTSTKTSVVNSSWKQISSIHEHDLSKADSEAVIYLNDDDNKKDFFQIFGERSFSEASPKKLKGPSNGKLLDKNDLKRSSSFTSCLSAYEEPNRSRSSDRDSLVSKEFDNSGEQKPDDRSKKTSAVSSDIPETNIDELLKNMKLKFSKEIFDNSLPSCTTEDFLDNSQISSISPLE